MDYILDTDVLIDIEKENKEVLAALERKVPAEDHFCITAPNLSEFAYGLLSRSSKSVKEGVERIDKYRLLNTTRGSALLCAQLKLALEKKGTVIPAFDVLIASITMDNGGTLITRDRHFSRISGLNVVLLE